jgi:predicted Zn-dependent protease
MATSRIEIFEQMLAGDPGNTMVMFGLAKEYEKAGDEVKLIELLERYLAAADDEGNAYGMLARAFERTKRCSSDFARPPRNGRRISDDLGK